MLSGKGTYPACALRGLALILVQEEREKTLGRATGMGRQARGVRRRQMQMFVWAAAARMLRWRLPARCTFLDST
jgi:hypothetical protein